METPKDKLRKIISEKKSDWVERAEWRIKNRHWLDYSSRIAVNIFKALDGSNQKTLAVKLNVSPQHISNILKGQENLTLETISKLEIALGIKLIEIPEFTTTFEVSSNPKGILKYIQGNAQGVIIDSGNYTYCDPQKTSKLAS